jgi:predicted Zn-dependent protease with MMP-like domain
MNIGMPPSIDDITAIAQALVDSLPDELLECFDDLDILVEEFPDDVTLGDLGVDQPYDLLGLYRAASEISPGVQKKVANGHDVLTLYRRPILDFWCEECSDFNDILRQVMIEEIGAHFDFSDEDIEELVARHHQGQL